MGREGGGRDKGVLCSVLPRSRVHPHCPRRSVPPGRSKEYSLLRFAADNYKIDHDRANLIVYNTHTQSYTIHLGLYKTL